MMSYADCWVQVATALFSQALAGEPVLSDALPKPLSPASFGFAAAISGDEAGRFSVMLDGSILETPLVGEGMDQKAGWKELLKEVADSAAGELLAKTGHKCKVDAFDPIDSENKISRAFQLQAGERSFVILVRDEVRVPKPVQQSVAAQPSTAQSAATQSAPKAAAPIQSPAPPPYPAPAAAPAPSFASLSQGLELLLDVELDASLRFGCREMPLGEILDLGPGDVVQLDRHVADPVDLLVGDKIVARGDVVLVNGNFGLRVTEVASPKMRLESIRCLF